MRCAQYGQAMATAGTPRGEFKRSATNRLAAESDSDGRLQRKVGHVGNRVGPNRPEVLPSRNNFRAGLKCARRKGARRVTGSGVGETSQPLAASREGSLTPVGRGARRPAGPVAASP